MSGGSNGVVESNHRFQVIAPGFRLDCGACHQRDTIGIFSAGSWLGRSEAAPGRRALSSPDGGTASHEGGQATKSTWWMPRRREAMKDAAGCDKPRGVVKRALIRGCPNGETRRHWATRWRHLRVNS